MQAGVWIHILENSDTGTVNKTVAGYKSGELGRKGANIINGTTHVTDLGTATPMAPHACIGTAAFTRTLRFTLTLRELRT